MQKINCHTLSDKDLVEKSLVNKNYFSCLIIKYENQLARYINRLSNLSNEDVQDILQEVFLSAYKNLNAFTPHLQFSSWIYRITHNKTISFFRKNHVKKHVDIDDSDCDKLCKNIVAISGEDFSSESEASLVNTVIAEMPEKYREIFILRFIEEKSYDEISDILQTPPGSVASLINRGRKIFSENIKIKYLSQKSGGNNE